MSFFFLQMWKLKEQNKTKAKQEKDLEAEEEL